MCSESLPARGETKFGDKVQDEVQDWVRVYPDQNLLDPATILIDIYPDITICAVTAAVSPENREFSQGDQAVNAAPSLGVA
jgi:hypothetical protein